MSNRCAHITFIALFEAIYICHDEATLQSFQQCNTRTVV